jgi:hypothetical protein
MPHPKKPASPKQLAANRANAAKSTGPRTAPGKARSAQNARKHGFTASTFAVVRLEDLQEVAHLKEDLVALYQPVNSQELFALERLALAQQALLRAARLEAGLFTTALNSACDCLGSPIELMNPELAGNGDIEITRQQNRNYLLGEGFQQMARKSNSWSLFLRYQAQAERHYRRAVEEFERLKALRDELSNGGLPNKPIFEPQPEQTETSCTPAGTKPSPPEAPGAGAGTMAIDEASPQTGTPVPIAIQAAGFQQASLSPCRQTWSSLSVCRAVHVHHRRRAPRDRRLEMAARAVHLHDGSRLHRGIRGPDNHDSPAGVSSWGVASGIRLHSKLEGEKRRVDAKLAQVRKVLKQRRSSKPSDRS